MSPRTSTVEKLATATVAETPAPAPASQRTFYIKSDLFSAHGSRMTIYDLTPLSPVPLDDLTTPSHPSLAADESDPLGPTTGHDRDHLPTVALPSEPYLLMTKNGVFSNHYTLTPAADPTADPTAPPLAVWHASLFSYGRTRITFPSSPSPLEMASTTPPPPAQHALRMAKDHVYGRDESFAVDSVPYSWCWDSIAVAKSMTLYRREPADRSMVRVGKYRGSRLGSSGTLVVETSEVGDVVAVVTCLVMLRKRRQRRRERAPMHAVTMAMGF